MNSTISRYADMLMQNNPNRSSNRKYKSTKKLQTGGNTDVPTGGFPPIFICDKKEPEKKDENKNREMASRKLGTTGPSIKTIMQKRRDVTPFIQDSTGQN